MLTRDRLGTFIAVVLSTAVVAAALLLWASSQPRVPDRFEDLSVVVQSPAAANPAEFFAETVPWPAAAARELADRLGELPGVTAVVQDRPFYAQPIRSGRPVPGLTTGYGWRAGVARLVAGAPPSGERDVVVGRDLGVPVGQDIILLTGTGPAPWRVTGHVEGSAVLVAEPVAARLQPGVRAIGLVGDPDPAAVRAVVGSAGTVLTGAGRGALEPRADARLRWIGTQVLSATVALAGFACVFLVASTSAFAVNQRRREIGLLRAVGATPRQIRSTLYRSALLVGGAAATVGVALGAVLAVSLDGFLVDAHFQPVGFSVRWEPWAPAVAFLAGPLVSLLGAAASARRASRIGPLEALRVAEVEDRPMSRPRWIAGLTAAAVGAAAGVYTATAASVTDMAQFALLGAMALVVAAALLAPAVVPWLVRLLLWPVSGITGSLVRESALAGVRRTASTAAPVLLTVAFGVFITGTVQTSTAAYAARRAAAVDTRTVLIPNGTPGLTDAAAPAAPLPTQVYVAGASVAAVGLPTQPPGTALVSPDSADRFGDSVTVTYGDGVQETLRITGTAPAGTVPAGPVPAELLLARDVVRDHDRSALAPAAFSAAAAATPGAEVVSVATYASRADAEEDRLVWSFTLLLLGMSAGAGALAVGNTLLMATRHRIRDYRVLRLAGATPRQVALTVALESALVVAIGSILGGATAMLALLGSAGSLSAQVGTEISVIVPWSLISLIVGGCLVLALGASTPSALRARPTR
ncbi:ABC transporter permease [Actinoplanes auranticolor]|uniref:ABC transporter permease n=1 Tax=Actinoplanes auranticolor TaxID=47988 RepID=A0A919S737_9ACTN|nr:ABC transporter permease [Actinoplanes auranticolor]GIM65638.1 ABC transporter permease [Actinoplanes auranticolor]